MEHVQNIIITFTPIGDPEYLSKVSNLIVGNMVSVGPKNTYLYGPINHNPYTWHYTNPANDVPFALMANYVYEGDVAHPKTALSKVAIYHNEMVGDVELEVFLETACVQGHASNPILRFKSVTGSAEAEIQKWAGQPVSTFCNTFSECKQ